MAKVLQGKFMREPITPPAQDQKPAWWPRPTSRRPPGFAQRRAESGRVRDEGRAVHFVSDDLLQGGSGEPLPPPTLRLLERVLGEDLADVRVREGPEARSIGALAFTVGNDIFFAPGLYQPHDAEGVALLGHEVAHVVQQRQGRVSVPAGAGLAVVEDGALEREADEVGARVAEAFSAGHVMQRRADPFAKWRAQERKRR